MHISTKRQEDERAASSTCSSQDSSPSGARDHRGPGWTPQGLFLHVVKADSRILERKEVRSGWIWLSQAGGLSADDPVGPSCLTIREAWPWVRVGSPRQDGDLVPTASQRAERRRCGQGGEGDRHREGGPLASGGGVAFVRILKLSCLLSGPHLLFYVDDELK